MVALSSRRAAIAALASLVGLLLLPGVAEAAVAHGAVLVPAGSIFSTIGHALLGAFSWTFALAEKFVLTTLGALVRLLIPRSWVHDGVQIMGWIVAVPDYAGQIATPGGAHHFGFAGVNDLRELFMWLGIALAPLTLTHATARALVDDSEPVGIPILRVVTTAAGIVLYPYLWTQAANLADQVTHLILSLPQVTDGIQKLMAYAVGGVALGGWQLIDLALMGAIGVALLGLIFMKVVLILVGAILYTTGPLMLGLVATRFGHAIARAWLSAVMFLLGIGIVWATIFAVGAVLINDADTAGPLIAGHSVFGSLVGGLLLAVAGLVALWLCLRIAREAGGLLRLQLGGMLALSAGGSSRASSVGASSRSRTSGASLRQFTGRVSAGAGAAGSELAHAVPGGQPVRRVLRGTASVGRRGLVRTAAAGARSAARPAAGPTAAILGRSRAGAVAVRMARSGTAAYRNPPAKPAPTTARPAVAAAGNERPAVAAAGNERPAVAAAGNERPAGRGRSRPQPGSATPAAASQNTEQLPARDRARSTAASPPPSPVHRAPADGADVRSSTPTGRERSPGAAGRSSSTGAAMSPSPAARPAGRGGPGRSSTSSSAAGRDRPVTTPVRRMSATRPSTASRKASTRPTAASRRSSTPTPTPRSTRAPAPRPGKRPSDGRRG